MDKCSCIIKRVILLEVTSSGKLHYCKRDTLFHWMRGRSGHYVVMTKRWSGSLTNDKSIREIYYACIYIACLSSVDNEGALMGRYFFSAVERDQSNFVQSCRQRNSTKYFSIELRWIAAAWSGRHFLKSALHRGIRERIFSAANILHIPFI